MFSVTQTVGKPIGGGNVLIFGKNLSLMGFKIKSFLFVGK